MSKPIVVACSMDASFGGSFDTVTLAHRCRRGASTPSPVRAIFAFNGKIDRSRSKAVLGISSRPGSSLLESTPDGVGNDAAVGRCGYPTSATRGSSGLSGLPRGLRTGHL